MSRSKEILLFKKIWSNNVTVANQYAESAIPHKTVHTLCYTGLCFTLKKPCQRTPKIFWIWSNQNQDFRFKRWRLRSHWKKGMNHKLPSFRCSLKIQRYLSCVIFTQRFLLFSTDFSIFDRNVNLSKINPEAENFFLAFPLAKIPRFLRRI